MLIVRGLLICFVVCSQFLFAESSSFNRGCDNPSACNYGSNNDCIFPPENECCPDFIVSIQSDNQETVCMPNEFEHAISSQLGSYIFFDVLLEFVLIF